MGKAIRLAILLALGLATAAKADQPLRAMVTLYTGTANNYQSTGYDAATGSTGPVAAAILDGTASADFGQLRSTAAATGNTPGQLVSRQAFAIFNDSLTVSTPGVDYGFLVGRLGVDGTLSVNSDAGTADAQTFIRLDTFSEDIESGYNLYNTSSLILEVESINGGPTDGYFAFNSGSPGYSDHDYSLSDSLGNGEFFNTGFDIYIPYRSGLAIDFSIELICTASVVGIGSAGCDFGNTVGWQGVSRIIDSNGNNITGAIATSSGLNFGAGYPGGSTPTGVPEPSLWVMWLIGFGIVGSIRRRGVLAA